MTISITNDSLKKKFGKWLALADVDPNEELRKIAARVEKPGGIREDVHQIERMLTDAAALLERCVGYHKDFLSMKSAALLRAADHSLFVEQARTLSALEKVDHVERMRLTERDAHLAASGEFAQDQGALPRGFAALSGGMARMADAGAGGETQRKDLIDEKWARLLAHEVWLRDRYSEVGHPLNFSERADQALELLYLDFEYAYRKLRVVCIGIHACWGITLAPPELSNEVFPLHKLLVWLKRALRQLDSVTERYAEREVIISFSEIASIKIGGGATLVDEFPEAFKAGTMPLFKFKLDRWEARIQGRLFGNSVIRGVGFSFVLKDYADQERLDLSFARGVLMPPNTYYRIEMPDIGIARSDARPRFYRGAGIWNFKPDEPGDWRLYFKSDIENAGAAKRYLADRLADIRMHLILWGELDPNPPGQNQEIKL